MQLGLLIFCRIHSPELSLGVSVVSTNHNGICCVVFPHPLGLIGDLLSFLVGRYYLADAGYMDMAGYMTSFRNTRYHMNDFRGSRFASVAAGGKIQLHSCKAAKCHRKEVWGLERTLVYSERGVVLP